MTYFGDTLPTKVSNNLARKFSSKIKLPLSLQVIAGWTAIDEPESHFPYLFNFHSLGLLLLPSATATLTFFI